MKKHIMPILLLVSPYLYFPILNTLNLILHKDSDLLIPLYFLMIAAVFVPGGIYAFVLLKRGEKSSALLFWDMLLKLCNIPIYLLIFIVGIGMTLFPPNFIFVPFLMFFDYILLLPSSMYGVSGLIQAVKEEKLSVFAAVVNGILHFFFCADVISAVVVFCKVKSKEKKQKERAYA